MNLMFWKKTRAADEAESARPEANAKPRESLDFVSAKPGTAAGNPQSPAIDSPSPAGNGIGDQVLRIKLRLTGLMRYFRKPPEFRAEELTQNSPEGRSETAPEGVARSRKRLVVGVAIGLLVLSLIGIGMAFWPTFTQPQKEPDSLHEVTGVASHANEPVPVPENSHTEIETLKKENIEPQSSVGGLKQEQQQSSVLPAQPATSGASSSRASGEKLIDNKDPKAAAASLKEAIEAMNASTGEHKKKPAK